MARASFSIDQVFTIEVAYPREHENHPEGIWAIGRIKCGDVVVFEQLYTDDWDFSDYDPSPFEYAGSEEEVRDGVVEQFGEKLAEVLSAKG